MRNRVMTIKGKNAMSTGNTSHLQARAEGGTGAASGIPRLAGEGEKLRSRAQQLSLREQIERNHFLLQRLNAASARLLQALETGDVHAAIGEIIANLIGSEQVAIFHYCPADEALLLDWSWGVEADTLRRFAPGTGMMGRAVNEGATQFRERLTGISLPSHEEKLTACVVLKSNREIAGVVAIFGLLPQKDRLEWADFELLKFLETYAAVAIRFCRLREKGVTP